MTAVRPSPAMPASPTRSRSCRCCCRASATEASRLISQYYGEGKPELAEKVKRLAYLCAIALALLCYLLLYALRGFIGPLFGASESVAREVEAVLPVFLIGLLFYGYSRITTANFYATERTAFSYICVYSEPALLLLFLFILPLFFGQAGVWWSAVLAQILTAGISLLLMLVGRGRAVYN